jgi:hypothetical protein
VHINNTLVNTIFKNKTIRLNLNFFYLATPTINVISKIGPTIKIIDVAIIDPDDAKIISYIVTTNSTKTNMQKL